MTTRTSFPELCAIAAVISLAAFFEAAAQEPAPGAPSIPGTIGDPNTPSSAAVLAPDEGPLVIPGDAPDMIFEFTGKVQGYVEPCG